MRCLPLSCQPYLVYQDWDSLLLRHPIRDKEKIFKKIHSNFFLYMCIHYMLHCIIFFNVYCFIFIKGHMKNKILCLIAVDYRFLKLLILTETIQLLSTYIIFSMSNVPQGHAMYIYFGLKNIGPNHLKIHEIKSAIEYFFSQFNLQSQ